MNFIHTELYYSTIPFRAASQGKLLASLVFVSKIKDKKAKTNDYIKSNIYFDYVRAHIFGATELFHVEFSFGISSFMFGHLRIHRTIVCRVTFLLVFNYALELLSNAYHTRSSLLFSNFVFSI